MRKPLPSIEKSQLPEAVAFFGSGVHVVLFKRSHAGL